MATANKLDTFILRDKFNLSMNQIEKEAFLSAKRRSEIMGWIDISVKQTPNPITIEGEFKCYSFEIWGIGEGYITDSEGNKIQNQAINTSDLAAKDINI